VDAAGDYDAVTPVYTHWGAGQPQEASGYECVGMQNNGEWVEIACDTVYFIGSALCNAPTSAPTSAPTKK
jgi:hypothetical protein